MEILRNYKNIYLFQVLLLLKKISKMELGTTFANRHRRIPIAFTSDVL